MLKVEPLEATAFAPYGDVVEARDGVARTLVNAGTAERFDDLARPDVSHAGGFARLSVFRAAPRGRPVRVALVERHCLGSQAFVPMQRQRWLVVVAAPGPAPAPAALRCFLAAPGQGVNYRRGTWHAPLIALDVEGDFLVVDRGGPEAASDCEEHVLPGGIDIAIV